MDFFIGILFIIEAALGAGSTLCIVVVMFATIIKKFYRKAKYGEAII